MNGIRVWLDLSALLSGLREKACIFLDHEKLPTVKDVEDHIRRLFGVNRAVQLLNEGWLLPSQESSLLLRDNETVSVVPEAESNQINLLGKNKEISTCPSKVSRDNDNSVLVRSERKRSYSSGEKKTMTAQVKSTPPDTTEDSGQIDPSTVKRNQQINSDHAKPSGATPSGVSSSGVTNGNVQPAGSLAKIPKLSFIKKDSTEQCLAQPSQEHDTSINSGNESGERKRKRIRRRKKKSKEAPEGEPQSKEVKQSPYVVNKLLQGVSHILNTAVSAESKTNLTAESKTNSERNKKHVFFNDEEVVHPPSPVTKKSESLPCNGDKQIHASTSPAASLHEGLSKLMALGNQKSPVVFERTKSNVSDAETSEIQAPSVAPNMSLLKTLPVKDSVIKFKILKMENYSPVISETITARVISPDITNNQIYVQVTDGLTELQSDKGKFSLYEEEEEDTPPSEYTLLNWQDLIEPMAVENFSPLAKPD